MRIVRRGALALLACSALLSLPGCPRNEPQTGPSPGQFGGRPYGAPGPGYGYPQGPQQGYGYPQQGYPQQGQPPPPQPLPGQPQQPAQPPLGPVVNDPINAVDIGWLRNEAGNVMGELIVALPAAAQARVKDIPFVADPTPGDVNAFAACDDQGLPLMAITDGLLEVEAHIAQYKAIDELAGSHKLEAYEQLLAQHMAPNTPVPRPPPGFTDPAQDVDGRKVARQHQIFEEQLAFVLGHELSHHHLGHTGCANGQGGSRGVSPADLARVLSHNVPLFNQPNEIAADVSGTQNLLTAGSRRQAYHWTEGGAVLTLQFFAALERLSAGSILMGFMRTHPLPQIRLPIVQQTAASWRATGGQGFQLPNWGSIFPQ